MRKRCGRLQRRDFPSAETAVNEVLHESPGYVPPLLLKARISIVQGRMVL
jgi:hypothetical protein